MSAAHWLAGVMALAVSAGALAASPEPPPGASSCTGCHAPGALAPRVDTAVPPLVGRSTADIVAQMQAFKTGQKASTVMDRIARGFTDAEIQAIADWYAQQR